MTGRKYGGNKSCFNTQQMSKLSFLNPWLFWLSKTSTSTSFPRAPINQVNTSLINVWQTSRNRAEELVFFGPVTGSYKWDVKPTSRGWPLAVRKGRGAMWKLEIVAHKDFVTATINCKKVPWVRPWKPDPMPLCTGCLKGLKTGLTSFVKTEPHHVPNGKRNSPEIGWRFVLKMLERLNPSTSCVDGRRRRNRYFQLHP